MEHLGKGEQAARRRLQRMVRDKGTSLAALSRLIGRNDAYLQQFVTRGSPRHLDEADEKKIAEFLGSAPALFETRRWDESKSASSPPFAAAPVRRDDDWIDVPRFPLDASAGPGAFGAQEISYDAIRFSPRWMREMGLEGADLSAIRVEGDSMEPVLRSGDEILVDRSKRSAEGIHVVRVGEALHVKQVQLAGPGRVKLVSANEDYAPIDLALDEVEIIGRVVWKGGRI